MIAIAGFFGATAVLAGAFGAHALKGSLPEDLLVVWNTAAHYHLLHSILLVLLALYGRSDVRARLPYQLIAAGITVFSGSLYILAISGIRTLGAITPIGGVLLVSGWLTLAWRFRKSTP